MKFKRMVALAALFLALLPAPLWAGDFYISAKGGLAGLESIDGEVFYADKNKRVKSLIQVNRGIYLSAAFGETKGAWRGEIELSAQKNGLDKWSKTFEGENLGNHSLGGDIFIASALGKVYYDFSPVLKINPYIGVGVGGAHVALVDAKKGALGEEPKYMMYKNQSATAPACQASVGFSYEITDHLLFDAGYHFLWVMNLKLKDLYGMNIQSHNATVGLRYLF